MWTLAVSSLLLSARRKNLSFLISNKNNLLFNMLFDFLPTWESQVRFMWCFILQKYSRARSLTCLYNGGWVPSAWGHGGHGWTVGDATGGNEVAGNVYRAGSLVWMPVGWHRSQGVAPWWRTAPQTPPPPCPASGSAGCRRTRCWGPKKCCSHWRSAAECYGSPAGPFPRGWRRWPRRSVSPALAGRRTQAEACSLGGGTRTGRQCLARSLHWGSKSAHLARRPAPHLEVLW